jgi:hypothetical protein
MNARDSEWIRRFGRQESLLPQKLPDVLRGSTVILVGLGAIGGAALHVLARSGIGRFVLIDPDAIAVENVAGQLFASTTTLGVDKAEVGRRLILDINPDATVSIIEKTSDLDTLCAVMSDADVVVLGMDTLAAGIACYRAARVTHTPVIDFLYFPTPNVVSTFPGEPPPEMRFNYPTQGLTGEALDQDVIVADALLRVVAYGFACCPDVFHAMDGRLIPMLRRFLRFEGPVPSFAPLTVETGALMAREALCAIAHVHGIGFARLGWPAFYIDTYNGRAIRPSSVWLSRLPGAKAWLHRLRALRDG